MDAHVQAFVFQQTFRIPLPRIGPYIWIIMDSKHIYQHLYNQHTMHLEMDIFGSWIFPITSCLISYLSFTFEFTFGSQRTWRNLLSVDFESTLNIHGCTHPIKWDRVLHLVFLEKGRDNMPIHSCKIPPTRLKNRWKNYIFHFPCDYIFLGSW